MLKKVNLRLILIIIILTLFQPINIEAKNYNKSDLRLLSSIIYSEAGNQSYAGKLAVGIVIVNRMNSKKFPNTIKEVIYQKKQFTPTINGSLNKSLKLYDKNKLDKDCIKAAKNALNGVKTVTYKGKKINCKKFVFFSAKVKNSKVTIQNHQFK